MKNAQKIFLFLSAFSTALWSSFAFASNETTDWTISLPIAGMTYDTRSRKLALRGVKREGLLSVRKNGESTLEMFWGKGAHKPTVTINGAKLVDGRDLEETSRLSSIRLGPKGTLVYLRATQAGKGPIELVANGKVVKVWAPRTAVKLLEFNSNGLVYSIRNATNGDVSFTRMELNADTQLTADRLKTLGTLSGCTSTGARSFSGGLLVEAFCNANKTSGIYYLGGDNSLTALSFKGTNSVVANGLLSKQTVKRMPNEFGMLSISGSYGALHAYHAINASLLSNLGEPASLATDEAGRQSWSQSYRTVAQAKLYQKTGHPVFAKLATLAMKNALSVRNSAIGIDGKNNPGCGWASRIYSQDKKTPVSFLVNQAMVSGGLIRACKALSDQCSAPLKRIIDQNSICLARHFEKDFDAPSALYKIPKAVPFRNDGLWAPWNWQTNWAYVLRHAAQATDNAATGKRWEKRAQSIIDAFLASVEPQTDGALWRYWPPQYYQGWKQEDAVSTNRVKFTPQDNERYEDVSHGGISLLATCEFGIAEELQKSLRRRLKTILGSGIAPSKDIDGRGANSSRWLPSIGWDCLGSKEMQSLYTKTLPGGKGGPRHLTYARLLEPNKPFDLSLTLHRCTLDGCRKEANWQYDSVQDYLEKSPFFNVSPSNQP